MAEESVVCFDYPSTDESDTTKKNQMQDPAGVVYAVAKKINICFGKYLLQ